ALSSTAIGLQMLAEKKQLNAPYGRQAFGVLLFQDIAVIPLLALIPLFGAGAGLDTDEAGLIWPIAKTTLIIAAIIFGGRLFLRPIFRVIVMSDVREIFLAAVLLVALGTALLADWAGLSMALGAFLAGVLLSDSEYRHELEAGIEPFKGLLLGLFFIAVGMSIDFGLVIEGPGLIVAMVALLMAVKFAVLVLVGRFAGLPPREAVSLAFALPQAGEFGFVLFTVSLEEQVLTSSVVDPLMVAITISMALTPLLFMLNERLIQPRLQPPVDDDERFDDIPDDEGEPRVIVAGLGRVGQIVARNLSMLDIHFTALDYDQEQVEFVRKFGHRVYYGNATNLDVLRAAGAGHAKLFILTISDIDISMRTAEMVRRYFPELNIYARARNRQHALELMHLGVDYVMRETWLSSIELSKVTLQALGVRRADRYVEQFRLHDEETLHEQVEHKDDFEQLVKIGRKSRKQLEALFADDRSFLKQNKNSDT
ncbi:MAG: cation:proton antiporter, partial [Pseudomonadota bacterium]